MNLDFEQRAKIDHQRAQYAGTARPCASALEDWIDGTKPEEEGCA